MEVVITTITRPVSSGVVYIGIGGGDEDPVTPPFIFDALEHDISVRNVAVLPLQGGITIECRDRFILERQKVCVVVHPSS